MTLPRLQMQPALTALTALTAFTVPAAETQEDPLQFVPLSLFPGGGAARSVSVWSFLLLWALGREGGWGEAVQTLSDAFTATLFIPVT